MNLYSHSVFSRFHKSFKVHVDISDCCAGAFLGPKEDKGELAIIAYFSER